MNERPILFSAPMVRAILARRKRQTRRIVKGQALKWLGPGMFTPAFVAHPDNALCPYGKPGDRLWVKETWFTPEAWDSIKPTDLPGGRGMPGVQINYAADLAPDSAILGRLRPSIFMRRWMSRITLEIVSVRVERLNEISEEDAIAEGIKPVSFGLTDHGFEWSPEEDATDTAVESYSRLWESINGPGSWSANPWVWVIEFNPVVQK